MLSSTGYSYQGNYQTVHCHEGLFPWLALLYQRIIPFHLKRARSVHALTFLGWNPTLCPNPPHPCLIIMIMQSSVTCATSVLLFQLTDCSSLGRDWGNCCWHTFLWRNRGTEEQSGVQVWTQTEYRTYLIFHTSSLSCSSSWASGSCSTTFCRSFTIWGGNFSYTHTAALILPLCSS